MVSSKDETLPEIVVEFEALALSRQRMAEVKALSLMFHIFLNITEHVLETTFQPLLLPYPHKLYYRTCPMLSGL